MILERVTTRKIFNQTASYNILLFVWIEEKKHY